MEFIGKAGEFINLEELHSQNAHHLSTNEDGALTVIWFLDNGSRLIIDGVSTEFEKDQIVFLTEFHQVKVEHLGKIRMVKFNRPFYCILDHDVEVGCKGILFFGASQLPVLKIPLNENERFQILWKMFLIEMDSTDGLKIEMLQMMLKRYLIMCTRIFKNQSNYPSENLESDLVREFNFLVEKHFRTKHTVAAYADLLNKSPKTISNLFSQISKKSPLQLIQERRALEAKRLLRYSEKQIQEVAYEIGFEDVQSFSRFFKNQEGISPSGYRNRWV